jgi:glycerol-3-phosphate O-acyltransferase
MNIRTPFNYIARKILYLLIKTDVFPSSFDQLGIDPDLPLVYVLDARAWSSLLVLEAECERLKLSSPLSKINAPLLNSWHSVYTIAPRKPFKSWLKKRPKRSRMIRGIVEVIRENPQQKIQFVPVSVFWGRPIAKQKHWLSVLFSDSWDLAGRTRKLLTIFFHGRNTHVHFSEVIRLDYENIQKKIDDDVIDALQQQLANRHMEMRKATLGPDISHRRTLLRKLLLTDDVQKAISRRSQEDNRTEYKVSLQARRYLNEIVADCTNITIQLMQRGLTWFWNKFYSGIEVHNQGYLKKLALTHELIYVPCHRSHIDYLLLSYVIYSEGLAIPYIAAGKNLNMPVIGSILRGGGAFFIRRSFKGNELYSTIMFEYVAELISTGMPIEYFIEGGRSRTGRLLQAKPGMLSMTIRGFLKYRKKPIAFIPVYIGYEKLLESKAYQAQLLGEDKNAETFISSIQSIFRIRGEFGKVAVNFSDPVYLNQLLDTQYSSWSIEDYIDTNRPRWLFDVVKQVSNKIMSHINQAVTVNPVNIISTILLATSKQHMDEAELIRMIDVYMSIIQALSYSDRVILTELEAQLQINHVESMAMIKRRAHPIGDIIYLDAKQAVSMTYYRNNILHLMALPSIIACCFFNVRSQTREEIIKLVSLAYPFIQKELFLVWRQEQLPEVIGQVLNMMSALGLLIKNEQMDVFTRPGSAAKEYTQMILLARVISPVLEIYYLTLALLSRRETDKVSRLELENRCYLISQRVAMIHELNAPDFSDKYLIANFINTLINIDYLKVYDTEHLEYSEVFHKADRRIHLLITKEMRSNILQMLKIEK